MRIEAWEHITLMLHVNVYTIQFQMGTLWQTLSLREGESTMLICNIHKHGDVEKGNYHENIIGLGFESKKILKKMQNRDSPPNPLPQV